MGRGGVFNWTTLSETNASKNDAVVGKDSVKTDVWQVHSEARLGREKKKKSQAKFEQILGISHGKQR